MKVALVVPGRFHAFDLARAFQRLGHQATILTNYPAWAVRRFNVQGAQVRSFWMHGVISRILFWIRDRFPFVPYPEVFLNRLFGAWAAWQLQRGRWDLIHCWSGISEEILKNRSYAGARLILVRESSHIRTQSKILETEEKRVGLRLDRPSRWILTREEREYALAEKIRVVSAFARRSFLEEGVAAEKICLIPSAVETLEFRPEGAVVERRCRRILSKQPLRVLYVGAISFRKGFWDLAEIIRRLHGKPFLFRLIGPVTAEAKRLKRELSGSAEFIPKQPQRALPNWYAQGDLFIFPTIEDGYAQVLAQAYASALPILTTTHCYGPELLREGETGWLFPIRSPEKFVDRLFWLELHRDSLEAAVRRIYAEGPVRTWEDVALDLGKLARSHHP